MICVIPFFGGDVRHAQDLLVWIGQLGFCKNHDCVLVADKETPWQDGREAFRLAKVVFNNVSFITNRESVKGWISGSNSLFRAAAEYCAGRVFFWLEPDAVPLRAGWLVEIENHYRNCGKPFMGTLVKHDNPVFPNPYFEGCGVYPANCWEHIKSIWNPQISWTKSCASVTVPLSAHTNLIHHLWGEAGTPPTFQETNQPGTNVFCLAQLFNKAVIFHRNKDGTLIRLLRKKFGIKEPSLPPAVHPKCFVQLGRYGDLILLMPAFLEWSKRTRRNVIVVTSDEFGTVFDGVSYVDSVRLRTDWQNGLPQALAYAKKTWRDVTLLQLNGGGMSPEPDGLPSFMLTMWKRTGLMEEYSKLPLIFDKRSPEREKALLSAVSRNGKPMLLYNAKSWTSPLKVHTEAQTFKQILGMCAAHFQLVDLGSIKAWRVYDTLGLFDAAAGLITIDTMSMHLAPASCLPYIAITRSDYRAGSVPKGNCVLNVGYADLSKHIKLIVDTIMGWLPNKTA